MESIKNRTSIRKYADREISEELLNSLLQEAERTPTMGNLQLYSVVVTRSEEGKKALAPAHFNQPMVTQAPVVLTICADYRRTTAWANHRKAHPGYDNILSFMNAATDALLFTQTFTVGDLIERRINDPLLLDLNIDEPVLELPYVKPADGSGASGFDAEVEDWIVIDNQIRF